MLKKIQKKLKEKKALSSYIWGVVLVLTFSLITMFINSYIKVRGISELIREIAQAENIKNIVSNYANVFHTARESYTGGFQPNLDRFEEVYINNIEENILNILDLKKQGNEFIKFDKENKEIYRITSIKTEIDNPALMSDKNIYINMKITLKIPIGFEDIKINFNPSINIASRYVTKF